MYFKKWLLNEEKRPFIRFTMFSSYGDISVIVADSKYKYNFDPLHYERIKNLASKRPFTALNFLKNLVSQGKATVVKV